MSDLMILRNLICVIMVTDALRSEWSQHGLTKGAIRSHSHTPGQGIQNSLFEVTGLVGLGIQVVHECLYSLVAVLFLTRRKKGGREGRRGGKEEGREEGRKDGREEGRGEGGTVVIRWCLNVYRVETE